MTARPGRRWNGVRMREALEAADPDSAPRDITLPADWTDEAAQALAALLPGADGASLPHEADRWIDGLAAGSAETGRALARLLLQGRAAPTAPAWRGDPVSGFVLRLSGFIKPGSGFETESFGDALALLTRLLRETTPAGTLPRLLRETTPAGTLPRLLLTDLDGCLAGLGLDYDGEPARDVARCLAAAAAGACDDVVSIGQLSLVRPPAQCPVPGLAALAARPGRPGRRIELGFSEPGPVDALLGAESSGIAPVFSAVRPDGRLRWSTMARLSTRGLSPEAALALSLSGDRVLAEPGRDAWLAMHRAVSGFAGRMPPLPEPRPVPSLASPVRRELPARRRGFTQKATIAGHKLFLQTGEFEDGSLGEVSITPPREAPAMRGLMDAFNRAVSLGLQHGVPLAAYVEAFAYARFGHAGAVEGDGSIAHATSLLDYAFRTLSESYLGRPLPDAPHAEAEFGGDDRPLLPLDLPEGPQRRPNGRSALRVVGGSMLGDRS